MILYHADIGFPRWFLGAPPGWLDVRYTTHALARTMEKNLPEVERLDLSTLDIIEIGVEGTRVEQYLVRFQIDERQDLCLVITRTGFIKTVWPNFRDDVHATLDPKRYARP